MRMANKIDDIITRVLNQCQSDQLKQSFARMICDQMSVRTIESLDDQELIEFVLQLYDFFIVRHHTGSTIFLGKPELESRALTNQTVLKMSHPDAPHLLFTLEELFRKYHVRITRRIHPILGIKRQSFGEVSELIDPEIADERRSLVFVAFEYIDERIKDAFLADIHFHMNAIQMSHSDDGAIHALLQDVSNQLQSLQSPNSNEWVRLIDWLDQQNFSFFGAHQVYYSDDNVTINNRLGICAKSLNIEALVSPPNYVLEHANEEPFIVGRTTILSPIQRFEPLMKVSFKLNQKQYIFYGILKRSSMYAKNIETPLIQSKMMYIFEQKNFMVGTYNYNEVIRIFNDIPKFELFRTPKEELLIMVDYLMSITNTNHIQCLKRYNKTTMYLRIYIALPYYFFSEQTVKLVTDYMCRTLDYSFYEVLPIQAPVKCRIHLHFRLNGTDTLPDDETIERHLTPLVLPWNEQLLGILQEQAPDILRKVPTIVDQIPSHYRVRTKPESAMRDIVRIIGLCDDNPIAFDLFPFLYPKTSDLAGRASMLLVYHRQKQDLTNILPILHDCGIHVIDQLTSRFGDEASTIGFIHAFRLLDYQHKKLNEANVKDRLLTVLHGVFSSTLTSDPLNQLVLTSSCNVDQLHMLHALRNYLYQVVQASFSRTVITNALLRYPNFVDGLMDIMDAKFNPAMKDRSNKQSAAMEHCLLALHDVETILDDQILKRFLSVVEACTRTNYYVKSADDAMSFKFDCQKIIGMPTPVPHKETFVFDVDLEGVHIRFGTVARGGLRHSSRIDDYRLEVFGLVTTQQTKNAVIVPVGSKGGFVIKKKDSTPDDAKIQYKRFIRAMLQLSDNYINQKPQCAPEIVAYDAFDPYFVVAADKGTATFSDIANDVSNQQQFWLGDAFASGGKHGYDHKKVGITAKGAWECVKLHAAAMGINTQTDAMTVVGVGDMSGDVFGNGMLLSSSICLIAAFNHQHIFVDPNPNPAKSAVERLRLFKKNRSTWLDYNGISSGGGVFERTQKSIPCSKEMKALFNIASDTVSGDELIRAILTASVDLIWFGGIGTYVKAQSESMVEVGDPANNSVRVNGMDIQAKIIGEGANLAMTQLARIESEHHGVRLNTDAIDNSAGVNMSDYEVNIKIVLSDLMTRGVLKSDAQRNELLESATDEVTALVLMNNKMQHNLISMDQYRSIHESPVFEASIHQLVQEGLLSIDDEQIPNLKERHDYYRMKRALPRSVIAKCQAYTKMRIKRELMQSPLFEQEVYLDRFLTYFPTKIRTLMVDHSIQEHPLKKELIVTLLTNEYVGLYGTGSYDAFTCNGRIPIDVAVHALAQLDTCFNFTVPDSECGNISAIIDINKQRLHSHYFCYFMGIELPSHGSKRLQDVDMDMNPIVRCLQLMEPPVSKETLTALNSAIHFEEMVHTLLNTSVTDGTEHEQKYALFIDMIDVLKLALSCNQLDCMSLDMPQTGKKDLARVYLYLFNVRQQLNQHNDHQ